MAFRRLHASQLFCVAVYCDFLFSACFAAKHLRQTLQPVLGIDGNTTATSEKPQISTQEFVADHSRARTSLSNWYDAEAAQAVETTAEQRQLFMRYSERLNLVVCSCAKCGSTSLYKYMYARLFGQDWPYRDYPWMQDVWTDRWDHLFALNDSPDDQRRVMGQNDTSSFALIRDPKERLISAWKSKAACEIELYDADIGAGRENLLRNFFALQDWGWTGITCLNLEDFIESLYNIHKLGRQRDLDRHVLPQHLGCFNRFPPEQWSVVSTVSDSSLYRRLSDSLHVPYKEQGGLDHFSTATVEVSPRVSEMLDYITAEEYDVLGPYLSEPSKVIPGNFVLAVHRSPKHLMDTAE